MPASVRHRGLRLTTLVLGLIALSVPPAVAELVLGSPFSNHVVLQADRPVPVWGWDTPGTAVAVTLGEHAAAAVCGANGRWEAALPAMDDLGPHELVVTGTSTLRLTDVAIGEVWYASGQSNMTFELSRSTGAAEELARPANPLLRVLHLPERSAERPADRIDALWAVDDPAARGDVSAVAWHFGRWLTEELDRPVGFVVAAWGGSRIRAWMPPEALERSGRAEEVRADRAEAVARHRRKLAAWQAAGATGKPPGLGGAAEHHSVGGLYDGMVHPLGPLAVRGVLWYQGESDAGNPPMYEALFPELVASWRQRFHDPDLPVLTVQLPNFSGWRADWTPFRKAQRRLAAAPELDLAVTVDVGVADDVHPPDKRPVGERLARLALSGVYGVDVLPGGPRPVSAVSGPGGVVTVRFDRVGSGLTLRDPALGCPSFELVAPDGTRTPATATLDADRATLKPQNPGPVASVAYAQARDPSVNLVNSEDLPAVPFLLPLTHAPE